MKIIETSFFCLTCGIRNYRINSINNHMRIINHRCVRRYKCLKCCKDFNSLSSVDAHNIYCHLKPMVKWVGGKSDDIQFFAEHIPNDYKLYLEPFVGGGAVYFHQMPKKAVIGDVHKELIDFYQCIKDGYGKEIYDFMSSNENTEENYYQIRNEMEVNNSLDNAKRFYYLRKTCYRGMLRYNKQGHFNMPFGKYKGYNYEDVKKTIYKSLLRTTEVKLEDFEYFFNNYNDSQNFMFIDPPYDSKNTDYGYCKFTQNDHRRLAKLIKNTKIRCLMIVGKTPMMSYLYRNLIVGEYDKRFRFKIHSGRAGTQEDMKHLIIKNF